MKNKALNCIIFIKMPLVTRDCISLSLSLYICQVYVFIILICNHVVYQLLFINETNIQEC